MFAIVDDYLYLCRRMTTLNLPPYPVRLAGTPEHPTIFDILRKRYVALTPEEWVRQHFVHFLISEKGYPPTLLANEVRLKIGDAPAIQTATRQGSKKVLRADTVLYNTQLQPRMIFEYKAPTIALSQKVFDQISVYNLLLHVDFLVVSNGLEHYCCRMDYERGTYEFITEIPEYEQISQ